MKNIRILFFVLSTVLFGCTEEDYVSKPDWEITSLQWKLDKAGSTSIYQRYYLEVKAKNNTNKTCDILSIEILLMDGNTIKERGIYMTTMDIIPNEEHTFPYYEGAIMAQGQPGYDETGFQKMNYKVKVGNITALYN